jgi:uncharacterized membrane protein
MRGAMALMSGAGLGAGLMYLLDPDRGDRRRARLGEAMNDAAERLGQQDMVSTMRDAGSRLASSDVLSGVRRAGARWNAPRFVSELASVARDPRVMRSMRPTWRDGRLSLRRRSSIAGGVWGLWRREPGEVRESVTVEAPPERVYDTWTKFENFPRFMPAVREVRATGADRNHWVVNGPAGTPVEFESIVTRREPPNALAWRTVEGALVSHGGTARFRPAGAGRTRVDVTMWWRPAGGGIGEGLAALSGVDPSHVLRQGLDRFKTELEQAKHGAKR